jgi:CheY-like chemotaxis protein
MERLTRDTIRIVHVDDDGDFAELSARDLTRAGFKQPVVRCMDGRLALAYFLALEPRTSPHVIILDLDMPHMNGLEVLRWVRQNYAQRDVAVYLLTSSEDPEHRRLAAVDGVTEYLPKSPLSENLIAKLDRLIDLLNTQREQNVDGGNEPAGMVANALVQRVLIAPRLP